MSKTKKRGSRVRWALMAMLAIQAAGAIAGGIGLIQDPVNNVGMPLSLLEGSPFSDYLVPGLILLIVVGLPPACALCGVARGQRWGVWLAAVAGAALVIWIITEVVLLGYLPGTGVGLQIAMGVLGLAIFATAIALMRSWRGTTPLPEGLDKGVGT
ncbi:MAG: hypothetical protein N3B14_04400 [Thermoleophilia bacterium]|nr:hypothetical protein [Thermoleophilia bacterium]